MESLLLYQKFQQKAPEPHLRFCMAWADHVPVPKHITTGGTMQLAAWPRRGLSRCGDGSDLHQPHGPRAVCFSRESPSATPGRHGIQRQAGGSHQSPALPSPGPERRRGSVTGGDAWAYCPFCFQTSRNVIVLLLLLFRTAEGMKVKAAMVSFK